MSTCRIGDSTILYGVIGLARILVLVVLALAGVLAGSFSGLLSTRTYLKLATVWHFCVTRIVGVDCRFNAEKHKPGALVVCNHVSWLDISVIGSRFPVVFLARSEIARWPILGWIIKKAGTLFIERGKGSRAAVKEIADSLRRNQSVLIFPEGRTTDGSAVTRFQPRLFQSAIDSDAMIQPVAIRYVDKCGQRVDRMSWHGNLSFLASLWRTVCGPGIVASIQVFQSIPATCSRDSLGQKAESCVKQWVKQWNDPAAKS